MMDLHELFDEVATDREPPTRLTADAVYTKGRRRARVQTAVRLSAVSAVVAVTAGVTAVVAASGGSRGTPDVVAGGSGSSTGNPGPVDFRGLDWVAAPDATHLYATVRPCARPNDARTSCAERLVASTDGGHTWTVRSSDRVPSTLYAFDANAFVGWRRADRLPLPKPSPGAAGTALRALSSDLVLSTDGGRHWQTVPTVATPVAAVPPGGFTTCIMNSTQTGTKVGNLACTVYAVDPVHLRAAPLANQPAADFFEFSSKAAFDPVVGDVLWLTGTTSPDSSPYRGTAVAVSRDRGRTWNTRTVDAACTGSASSWHSTGGVAKVMCTDDKGASRLYRTDDYGATWQRTTVPPAPFANSKALYEMGDDFGNDGTLVLTQYPVENGVRMWTLDETRGAWHPVPIRNLPPSAVNVNQQPDGTYLAYGVSEGGFNVYRSTDLTTWTHIIVRP